MVEEKPFGFVLSEAHILVRPFQSILSRPPGYRDLELDDYGNVISIAKLDPDKLGPRRSI